MVNRHTVRQDMVKLFIKEDEMAKCPFREQISVVSVHKPAAKGPTYARALTRKLLGNQEYCMQIDAHTDFAKSWDEHLKAEWKATHNEFAVISTVPYPTTAKSEAKPGASKGREVSRACQVRFNDNGIPDYRSPADGYASNLEAPLLSHSWSAAFSFAKCHFEESVPNDAFSYYAKPIEQFPRYVRMWTRGYDVYTPTQNYVFHDYSEQENGHGNNEWFRKNMKQRFRDESVNRAKMIIGAPTDENYSDSDIANLGIYGPGKRRTIKQLEEFMSIDISAKKSNSGSEVKCVHSEWVPYDEKISPVENLYDEPTNLESQPEYPKRTQLVFYEQVVEADAAVEIPNVQVVPDSFHEDPHTKFPPLSLLFVLWVFGLVVWCIMFAPSSKTSRKRKQRIAKDV